MIGKIHVNETNILFACCDKEILNKEIKFNDTSIVISNKFYGTEELSEKEILKNIEECTQANVFGKKACALLLDKKIITKENIMDINGVPHVQIYKM